MGMKSIQIGKKGQSLVEVVVACGIIGIILTGMMIMVLASKNLLYTSEEKTIATALAQQGIDIARHQRDIGCSFSNIINSDGSLKTGPFVIEGDTNGTEDEDIVPYGSSDPNNIKDNSGFARFVIIEELASNTSDISTVGFQNDLNDGKCDQTPMDSGDYDCTDKYYAIRVDIHKDNGSGPIVSQARTIIAK
ncbi:hypothetical protein C4544_00775 [candidate division WS5 bacterium]|uniref:Type II secretion system protein n=1 Tax=candidate division WS5 bacterium TaxID=2093353 RepID=A0A419DFY3_9BACT|nr:MAG: hypothetical protein C4544_00775 [candidate division WS5 bacterium]